MDSDGEPAGEFGDAHTLNVWSAVDGPAPVLLWVHGGANTVGSSSQPEYAGDVLASHGIVFVSCNYRLAVDGYGALEGVPHNRGLLDVVSALRWIQRNIKRYGGDPGNVTVAGQSSGAQTVASLMVMPAARGLFHRAIAHSLAGRFFTPAEAVEVQRAADPEVVLYQPIVDGDSLPRSPLEGPYDVDLLVCHTADEDADLFQRPTMRLADEHGRAFRSIYAKKPAHHGADVPDMFRGDIAQAWARFARDGDPGWPREELKRWVSSPS
ncbi:carboxylesterase family protein [Lentzea aerocolonigenes]|uniref:carboxylesterase family protein n=1 Tax=Lentzea aerocolonigenes TaxID=68170 RepID=UPI00068B42B6|nr:carboxylesterase family protein [Lentzea aerocolonigenes]MCP2244923.1 Carboxylesterase family protein [Lentzea aerocolonigenes]